MKKSNNYIILINSRIVAFLIFSVTFFSFLSSYSQDDVLEVKVSISATNIQLDEVLQTLERKAGISFVYNPDLLDDRQLVDVYAENIPVKDIMGKVFENINHSTSVVGNMVVVKYISDKPAVKPLEKKVKPTPAFKFEYKALEPVKKEIKIIPDSESKPAPLPQRDTVLIESVLKANTNIELNPMFSGDTALHIGNFNYNSKPSYENTNKVTWYLEPSFFCGIYNDKFSETDYLHQDNTYEIINAKHNNTFYGSGLNIALVNNKLSLKTGLSIAKHKYDIDYNFSGTHKNQSFDTTTIWQRKLLTWYEVENSQGGTDIYNVYDSTLVDSIYPMYTIDSSKLNYKGKGSYTGISIPVIIGYSFQLNERLKTTINAGVIMNIIISKSGGISIIDNSDTFIDNTSDNYLNINYSYYLSADLQYKIRYNTEVFGSVFFTQNLSPYYKDSYFERKAYSFGLQFGLRYYFNP